MRHRMHLRRHWLHEFSRREMLPKCNLNPTTPQELTEEHKNTKICFDEAVVSERPKHTMQSLQHFDLIGNLLYLHSHLLGRDHS